MSSVKQLRLQNGFSLLELLVVMLIMSIALGLFLGYNYSQRDTAMLRSAVNETRQFLRMAQGFAILEGRDNECLYLSEGHVLRESLRGRELALPDVVRLDVEDDQRPRNEEHALVALFYGDGSALGNTVKLSAANLDMLITIDPILGETRVDERMRK